MNRRVRCAIFVVLTVAACAPQAWGSSITLLSDTPISLPIDNGDISDISAAGNLDWVVSVVDEKAGASVIATGGTPLLGPSGTGVFPSVSYTGIWDGPNFSWTDGTVTPVSVDSNSGLNIAFSYYGSSPTLGTTLTLPAGSGSLTIWWCAIDSVYAANFHVGFADSSSYTSPTTTGTAAFKSVLSWQTDTAQTLTFESSADGTGIFAMAVSQVPEPGPVSLLGTLCACLSGYVWRKRRRARV